MRTTTSTRDRIHAVIASIGAVAACAVSGAAAPPLTPLPRPLYSFDLESPSVIAGLVGAADILELGPAGPVVLVPGVNLGAGAPIDDLDSLSGAHQNWPIGLSFALLFSVDRATLGVAPPDPLLASAGVPFNVVDQVGRGHAAGDQFMSTSVFTLFDPPNGERADRGFNNSQVGNNYDEGGTSFGATPPTSSSDTTPGASQDSLDGAAAKNSSLRDLPSHVYFSLTRQSPSLIPLSTGGQPSGANIFFNPAPLDFAPTEVFARFSQLQLTANDDIDALIVFDLNSDGLYNAGDAVLFSLAPGSPRLSTIPGHSPVGAGADVFIARPGATTTTLINAATLGLGQPGDNIRALEVLPCPDGNACALQFGIRLRRGDLDCDGDVDFFDIDPFVLALSGPGNYNAAYPHCFWNAADANCNGLVDFFDIDPFVACLTGDCPCR